MAAATAVPTTTSVAPANALAAATGAGAAEFSAITIFTTAIIVTLITLITLTLVLSTTIHSFCGIRTNTTAVVVAIAIAIASISISISTFQCAQPDHDIHISTYIQPRCAPPLTCLVVVSVFTFTPSCIRSFSKSAALSAGSSRQQPSGGHQPSISTPTPAPTR